MADIILVTALFTSPVCIFDESAQLVILFFFFVAFCERS